MDIKVIKKNGRHGRPATYRLQRCYFGFYWVNIQDYNPKTKKYEPVSFKTKKGRYGLDEYLSGAFPGANIDTAY